MTNVPLDVCARDVHLGCAPVCAPAAMHGVGTKCVNGLCGTGIAARDSAWCEVCTCSLSGCLVGNAVTCCVVGMAAWDLELP